MDLGALNWSVAVDTSDLSRAEREMDNTRTSAEGAGRGMDDMGNRSEKAGRKVRTATERMESGLSGVMRVAGLAAAALASVGVGMGLSNGVRQIADFQGAMNGLAATSGATAKQMESLEKQARTLGATSMFSAQQAGEAQRFLAQAGFEVNEVLSATPGILKLATAGGLDLASAADIASNVLGGMRYEVDQLNRVNDVLAATASRSNTDIQQLGNALSYAAPFAASANVSIEELAASIGVMSDAGIQGSRAGTGMIGVIRQLSNVTKEGQNVLAQYGLSMQDVSIETRGLEPVLLSLREAGLNTQDAIKLFGSEAGAAAQVLVNDFKGAITDANGEVDRMALILGQGLGPAFKSLGSALSESTLQLGDSGLAGALENAAGSAAGVLSVYNGMTSEFARANELTEDQTTRLVNIAAGAKGAATAIGAMTTVIVAYTSATTLATTATRAFQAAIAVIRANPIIAAVTAVVGLGAAIYGARDALVTFGDTQARMQDWARAAWTATTNVIGDAWAKSMGFVQNQFEGLIDWMGKATGWWWDTFQSVYSNVIDGAKWAVNGAVAYFMTFVDAVSTISRLMRDGFKNAFENILDIAKGFGTSLKDILSGNFSFDAFRDAVNGAVLEPLTGAFNEISASAQRNFSRDYVGDYVGMAAEAIRGFGDDVSDLAFSYRYAGNETEEAAKGFEELGLSGEESAKDIQKLIDSIDGATGSGKKSKTTTDELARSYQQLRDRLRPVEAEHRKLNQEKATLIAYAARENMAAEELSGLMRDLERDYMNTGDAAEVCGLKGAKAVDEVKTATDQLIENTLNRLDNTFQDLWSGMIDGSRNAMDTLKKLFSETLAEMAHAAITKSILVGFQADLGQMMSGNGFSLGGTAGAAKDVFGLGKAAGGIFGGSQAAATGGLYANAATAGAGGLYGSAATGAAMGSGAASAGIMSSITAGVSAAMPWIAGGLAIDSLLGGKITGAISGLFGSKTKPRLNVSTYGERSAFNHDSVAESRLGVVGFGKGTRRSDEMFGSVEKEREWLQMVAANDDLWAQMKPEKIEDMSRALQGVHLSAGDAASANDMLVQRTMAVARVIDVDFANTLQAQGATLEQITQRFMNATQAMDSLSSVAGRLNLQWDSARQGAMQYADAITQQVGGIQNLNALQSSYFETYFSEGERAVALQDDITRTLAAMGAQLPETNAGFRALVEAQDLNTEAGSRNYATLLQVSGAFNDLQAMLETTSDSANEATAAVQNFSEAINKQRSLENEILRLRGDESALREREIESLRQIAGAEEYGLEMLQRRKWALEDEAAAQQRAQRASEEASRAAQQAAQASARAFDNMLKGLASSISANMSGVESSYRALVSSVDNEQQILRAAYDRTTSIINNNISSARSAMSKTRDVADSLSSTLRKMIADERGLAFSRRNAQSYLQETLNGRGLGDPDRLNDALNAVSQPSEALFGSFVDYQRDFWQTAGMIEELENRAGKQLTQEERAVQALERQLVVSESQFNSEMGKLDSLLERESAALEVQFGQLGWLEQINGSVLSLGDALKGLKTATSTAAPMSNADIRSAASHIAATTPGGWDEKDYAIGIAAIKKGVSSQQLANALGKDHSGILERAKELGLPAFANGGNHSGGWRMVGERGPELEWTPPSKIVSNGDSKKMLGDEMAAEIKELREDLRNALRPVADASQKTANQLEEWNYAGQPPVRKPVEA